MLSRALIYGGASVVIVMTYAVALVLASRWFSERADVAASLVATVLVVLALSSVKDRLERKVRRTLFGAGTTNYELLARMSSTVDQFGGTDELLGRLVRDVRSGLHLRYVAIQPADGGSRIGAGRETPASDSVLLAHDAHVYGELPRGHSREGAALARGPCPARERRHADRRRPQNRGARLGAAGVA